MMSFSLLFSLLLGSSLEAFAANAVQGVSWTSLEHTHRYENKELEAAVDAIIARYMEDPESLKEEAQKLPLIMRNSLTTDDLDSRTDRIDLLSIELKHAFLREIGERVEAENYDLDPSEIWSLAKTSLKESLMPSRELAAGVTVAKERGMKARSALFLCVDGAVESNRTVENFDVGPLQLSLIRWDEAPEETAEASSLTTWTCGSNTFEVESIIQEAAYDFEIGPLTPPAKKNWRVVVNLGITETISDFVLNFNKFWLQWVFGYQVKSAKMGDLRTFLTKELTEADLLIPLINFPNANEINFSLKAEDATFLKMERFFADTGVTIELHLLLPPVSSPEIKERLRQQSGVRFTAEELRPLFGSSPPAIVELACFSEKFFSRWTHLFAYPGNREVPFILGSKAGHAAETPLQILAKLHLMTGFLEELATEGDWQKHLQKGTFLEEVFFTFGLIPEVGYEPVTNQEPPHPQLLNRQGSQTIRLQPPGQKAEVMVYPPLPKE